MRRASRQASFVPIDRGLHARSAGRILNHMVQYLTTAFAHGKGEPDKRASDFARLHCARLLTPCGLTRVLRPELPLRELMAIPQYAIGDNDSHAMGRRDVLQRIAVDHGEVGETSRFYRTKVEPERLR